MWTEPRENYSHLVLKCIEGSSPVITTDKIRLHLDFVQGPKGRIVTLLRQVIPPEGGGGGITALHIISVNTVTELNHSSLEICV